MQSGTVTVLSGEKELKCMKYSRMQSQISILKCRRFWKTKTNSTNLRSNSFEGNVKYESEWGYLYDKDCEICKLKNECIRNCKHENPCKVYLMRMEECVVRVRRMNVNAKLPVRGTARAVGYDLAAAQAIVVPAYGKCLVKAGVVYWKS